VRVLLATDSFPPNCGGSGWSTWELARGLRSRGHDVIVVQPRPEQATGGTREFDGFVVDEFAVHAPSIPFARNYARNERLYPRLGAHLAEVAKRERVDVIHGQHVLTIPAAVHAGHRTRRPVVATIRDYWPVCYWGTLIYDDEAADLCPACTVSGMGRCLRPRTGAAWPLALGAIPYMRRNLRIKRSTLGDADAIIAVSRQIASDLRARAPELRNVPIDQIPNPFDIAALRAEAAQSPRPLASPYALAVGKLETNKGADLLPRVAHDAGLGMALVVVGDGRLRGSIEGEARALGVDLRVTGWVPRASALGWLAGASLLVFPSRGPESLSRVLIEAASLGVPIAAMLTGGTADIVQHGVTGLLSPDAAGLSRDTARLAADPGLASSLGSAARAHVEREFDAPRVVARIEAVYERAIAARASRG
jgi:glycosyltransferase involved in cell wall biosynthesis